MVLAARRWSLRLNSSILQLFRVEWTDTKVASVYRAVLGQVCVDGVDCGSTQMQIQPGTPRVSKAVLEDGIVSETTCRPLLFSKRSLTDDDNYLNVPVSADLGSIKLCILHVRWKGTQRRRSSNVSLGEEAVHERSKKVISHSVQLGDEFETEIALWAAEVIKVLVIFTFKYRPMEILQAQKIIPHAPGEDKPRSEFIDSTMDADEDEENDKAEVKQLLTMQLTVAEMDEEEPEDEIKRLESQAQIKTLKEKKT
ncbi:hypothetical protein C8R43DRAFT_1125277 [Mycena crocata]|nr:hypothetical protein C8R43DRAFT_1125277 [Mycena crocata]